ncbi:AI-2E family transporter [Oceanobacillus neutriphilus]|uniref:AI-2E family transporter n=1 Tax=Oceanobacillus neutriphilus TaxID=531815 RepID=A0ABQ2NYL2_9BACI|nr:AI-2E family transporter [Oceanobacillus neutriphilus]GGP13726.1 AI-2E family transporter [Oceanobacillus neutriphilus]
MWKKIKAKQVIYYLVIAILSFILLYFLAITKPYYGAFFSFIGKLLLPFLIAGVLAFLLHPLIEWLHRHRIHRGIAVLIIYVLFFGGAGYAIYRAYPLMVEQIKEMSRNFPEFIALYQNGLNKMYTSTSFLPETVHDRMDMFIQSLEDTMNSFSGKIIGGFNGMMDAIILLTIIPVLLFYFLKDYPFIKSFLFRFIPYKYRDETGSVCREISKGLSGYIRGQFIISAAVGIISTLCWMWLDLPYALLLGIILAIVNIIPYFGPIIGAVPVVTVAYMVQPEKALFVVIIIFVIQLIESNLLSPYIMGKTVKIHPIGIIFALLLGGQLAGVIGMVISVPIFTMLKVLIQQYQISKAG